jgi:CRISPR-associated endoribonuclease Cas6
VKNKGVSIPFHHQYLISQILKGLIISGEKQEYAQFNKYSFSGLKGQTNVSRSGLHFNSSKVTLVVTSPDAEFIDYLITRIFKQTHLEISSLILVPEYVEEETSIDLTNETKLICLSPMVILQPTFNSDEGKQFIEPGTDQFSDLVYQSTIQQMENYGIATESIKDIDRFQIVPDAEYLNRLREKGKKFARIYPLFHEDVKYEVRGYTFPFTLFAPREVQDFVFTRGIGLFCEKGFGLADLANQDPTERTIPYEVSHLLSA